MDLDDCTSCPITRATYSSVAGDPKNGLSCWNPQTPVKRTLLNSYALYVRVRTLQNQRSENGLADED